MASQLADQIERLLSSGVASASELAAQLKVSQPTISRGIADLSRAHRIARMGATRGARYGLLRAIADIGSSWSLYRVDSTGQASQIASLHALAADEYLIEPRSGLDRRRIGGLGHGLPYYLQDQRPGGFLGRAVPRQFPELNLPQRVVDWSDDHYLRYFTRHGGNAVGDLVLGEAALNEVLAARAKQFSIPLGLREARYAELADLAMAGGIPGSSAHGEHPKFVAVIESQEGLQHVLVKFSPPRDSSVGQRWSDLLVAEHMAHRVINDHGAPFELRACNSTIVFGARRTYLEVSRFDRRGEFGRVGVASLFSIDSEFYGQLDSWASAGARLLSDGRIDETVLRQLRLASAFGQLIGNTDRHFGNIAFFDDHSGPFKLAPIYDMLPMLFAPEHGQVIDRDFDAPHATADTLEVWSAARLMAHAYWATLAADDRVSAEFRALCARCGGAIDAAA